MLSHDRLGENEPTEHDLGLDWQFGRNHRPGLKHVSDFNTIDETLPQYCLMQQ
jgi:hypothetical protein